MLAMAVMAYLAGVGMLYAYQRDLVFDTVGTGGLKGPGALAIPGSDRVTIRTSDGERIAGWYLKPTSAYRPVFLFLHGKGGGLERKVWRWRRIAKRGAGILAISYRGYVGSTGGPSEEGLYEDARAGYRWLTGRHRPENIVLHGLSLGTGVAAKLATEVEAKAVILEAPYTAIEDVAAERYPWVPVSWLLEHTFRTRDFIGRVRMPLMIVHGDRDTVIPYAHAKRLFRLAPDPKTLVTIPGGDHSTLVRDGLYKKIWPFLKGL